MNAITHNESGEMCADIRLRDITDPAAHTPATQRKSGCTGDAEQVQSGCRAEVIGYAVGSGGSLVCV